ncbi:MAG TPA: NADH-quinone oxidoreductase subunit J, partial [candidate division Zixibacteria bacterium]|nr:NADH-quinone oxidoreductase subunit J [candidate division Zixibacteria bacterium]
MPATTAEMIQTIVFYGLALVALLSAFVVVTSRRVLRSAVSLAVTLVTSAGFYVLLDYDFIAGIQILVYVGGIVILIVYAVMLTSSLELLEDHPSPQRQALGIVGALAFLVVTLSALLLTVFPDLTATAPPANLAVEIGRRL